MRKIITARNNGRLLIEILDRVFEFPCHSDNKHRVSVPGGIFDTSNGRIYEGAGVKKEFYGHKLETGALVSKSGLIYCSENCLLSA